MSRMTFHERNRSELALTPQSIAAASTAVGKGIFNIARRGSGAAVAFILQGGDMTGVTTLTVALEAQQVSDDAWVAFKDKDDVAIVFPAAKTIAGGELDSNVNSGILVGTVPIERVGNEFKALRLNVTAVAGATVNVAATAITFELAEVPAGFNQDDFLFRILPGTGPVT